MKRRLQIFGALLVSLFLLMGVYLLYHDLFSLISQQRSVLEKTAYTTSRLIPTASIELASLTKDSRTSNDSQLQDRLFNLQTDLKISGSLSIVDVKSEKVLCSTKAGLRKGDTYLLPTFDLTRENSFSTSINHHDGAFHLNAYAPIRNATGQLLAVVALDSEESAFILRLIGYGLHYLLLALGLITIGGFVFLWISNRTSRSLRHMKDRYFTLFRESSDGIIILDATGSVQKINKAALETFHIEESDVVGKDLLQPQGNPFHFVPLEPTKDIRKQTLAMGTHFHSKAKLVLATDKIRYLRYSSYPLTERGGTAGALIIFQDISADFIREQELQHDRSQLRSKNIELQQQVITDPLTHTLNKQYLYHLLDEKNLKWMSIEGCSMLVIDIDNFKQVNDSYGHAKGDQLLQSFAHFLHGFFRRSDKVVRFGGDEFIVILPQTDIQSAARIASNMNEKLHKQTFSPALTVSIGVAELRLDEKGDEWLERADRALYQAKHAGKNAVRVNDLSQLEVLN
jgi:diguanylate cyclase (GGDEF)-like protein/PAS domain S-box-containing protein